MHAHPEKAAYADISIPRAGQGRRPWPAAEPFLGSDDPVVNSPEDPAKAF